MAALGKITGKIINMNKQHLQNILELAKMGLATGRITDGNQLIAAGVAINATESMLSRMVDGQVLLPVGEPTGAAAILDDLNKQARPKPLPAEQMKAMKKSFAKAGAKAGEKMADSPE